MLTRRLLFAITLLVCWQCFLRETKASSYLPAHPQEKFCRAKYVFKFIPMAEMNVNAGRSKRYTRSYRMPNPMMVEVEQFFKGEEMAMSMMEMAPAENDTLDDIFSEHKRRIEAAIIPIDTTLEKNKPYIYFGRIMFRSDENNGGRKTIMANMDNTLAEEDVSKIMRRGIRKKYRKGCESGCRVATVFRKMDAEGDENYCYFDYRAYASNEEDCCVRSQFCRKGANGLCQWKKTKAYKLCKHKNAALKKSLDNKAQRRMP